MKKSLALSNTRKAQEFGEKPGRVLPGWRGGWGHIVKSPQYLVSLIFLKKLLKGLFRMHVTREQVYLRKRGRHSWIYFFKGSQLSD